MSNQTHAPGPWYVIADPVWKGKHPYHDHRYITTSQETIIYREDEEEAGWNFENPQDSIICTMPDAQEQAANARLIAAAPELLRFAFDMRGYLDMKLQGFRQDYPENHAMVQTALRYLQECDALIAKAKGEA